MPSPDARFKKRLLYLSGALRVSTHPQAFVGGARAHVLGVIKAFESLGWQVSPCIAGDHVFWSRAMRMLDRGRSAGPVKRMLADLVRLLCGFILRRAIAGKLSRCDWVYERAGSFQNLGTGCSKKGVPWILEANALLYQEAFAERRSIYFQRLAKKMEMRAYRDCDVLVCVSEGLKAAIVAASGIGPEKAIVSPNGVDTEIFHPGVRPQQRFFEQPTIGFVGTMYAWQGLDLLLAALAALAREGVGLKLVLAGDGPALNDLRRQAGALGIAGAVRFIGRIGWQDMPACIAAFDIGYSGQVGSQGGEWCGSPIKIYEFMAMAKPVIASAFEDARRAIDPGRTGYLFRPGDAAALADSLSSAFSQRGQWPEMGRLARLEVEREHSWVHGVGAMIARIHRILEVR